MNDRSATVEIYRATGGVRRQRAHVRAIEHPHALVLPQRPGQLPIPDVDGDYLGGTRAEQHIGEAPRGGTGVQAAPARDGDLRELGQRAGQLVPAPGRVARIIAVDHPNRGVGVDRGRRLAGHHAADLDPARGHQFRRVLP